MQVGREEYVRVGREVCLLTPRDVINLPPPHKSFLGKHTPMTVGIDPATFPSHLTLPSANEKVIIEPDSSGFYCLVCMNCAHVTARKVQFGPMLTCTHTPTDISIQCILHTEELHGQPPNRSSWTADPSLNPARNGPYNNYSGWVDRGQPVRWRMESEAPVMFSLFHATFVFFFL